jgi:phage host-nuclease inhibitor protein Gam
VAKLTQAEVKEKVDLWAAKNVEHEKLCAKYETATAAIYDRQQQELDDLIEKHEAELAPIAKKHTPKIERVATEIETLHSEVIGWLKTQKKSLTLQTDSAIAEFYKGQKESKDRVVSVEGFLQFVKTKGDGPVYRCMRVGLKEAEELIGKTELDKICSKPKKDVEEATLELK